MEHLGHLALILIGGPAVIGGVALTARAFVYRQSDPRRGREYLQWFRAQKAAEHDEAVRAELARQTTVDRPKELAR